MKTALLAFFFTVSAFASDCYVRNVDLVTNKVSLAKEFCVDGIKLNLEVFGNSKAVIEYSLDGVPATKEVSLVRPIERRDGKVIFLVFNLQSDSEGGWCSDMVEASIDAVLVMNKDATEVKLEEIKGSVGETYDNCHSNTREIQSFTYNKI